MTLENTEKDVSIFFEKLAITSIGGDHCKTPYNYFFTFQIKTSCNNRGNKREEKAFGH